MISKTLEDIEKDIKYLKEIANEEYFKKVEELCEEVNARSYKLQDRIDKAIEYIRSEYTITDDDVYLALYSSDGTLGKLESILKGDNK